MKWPKLVASVCALTSSAAIASEGPGVTLGAHHQWLILTDSSSFDRIDFGQIVLTNSRSVRREWATQSLWTRMQARLIVLPRSVYAAIAGRAQRLSCKEDPAVQPGLLTVHRSDGRGHETICFLVRPASCEFVAQVIDRARISAPQMEDLVRLRRTLTC